MSGCGPVVGAVTTSTARVLVDVPAGGNVRVVAKAGNAVAAEATVAATADRPVVAVTLTGLAAGTSHAIDVTVDGTVFGKGSFVTHHDDDDHWSYIAVSCNDYDFSRGWDPYTKLYEDYVHPSATGVIHMGDQVYGDRTFRSCAGALAQVPRADWPRYASWIRNAYRQLYRDTWTQPGLSHILANCSNLMIWDDHEVTDDWADRDRFVDPDTVDHFVSRQAWGAYREYQRQLWTDLTDLPEDGEPEHHLHTHGRLGMLFIDCRGGRAYKTAAQLAPRPYLGATQWQDIGRGLADDGKFANVDTLLVVCPVPLVFMGPRATFNYDGDFDDLFGHWSHEPYQDEQYQLLLQLSAWQGKRPGREVILLGGDVHVGALINVYERRGRLDPNGRKMRELISSPIRRDTRGQVTGAAYLSAIGSDRLLFRDRRPTYAFTIENSMLGTNAGWVQVARGLNGNQVTLRLIEV